MVDIFPTMKKIKVVILYGGFSDERKVFKINTTSGMTATSLVPQQAKAAGVSFLELINKLIDEA